MVNESIWKIWPHLEHADAGHQIKKCMADRVGSGTNIYHVVGDNKEVWLDFRVHPWGTGVAIFTVDVSELRRVELEKIELERRYALATRATQDVIYDWNLETDVAKISELGTTLLAMPRIMHDPKKWFADHLHPDDKCKTYEKLQATLRSRAQIWTSEHRLRVDDSGRHALIFERGYIIYDEQAKPVRIVGALTDVTEARALQKQVDKLQGELIHVSGVSAMGTMASALAHELNQPLAGIGTYLAGAEHLLTESPKPNIELAITGIQHARDGVMRAGEIIRRLRSMVRRSEPKRETINVLNMIRDSVAMALLSRPDYEDRIAIRAPEHLVIRADPIQLQQVVINILRNAIEANDEVDGGAIQVNVSMDLPGMVVISVQDEGPGISSDVKDKLFDFFLSTKTEGLGVGLPISRTIIEAHGGYITVENSTSRGAIFSIHLPRRVKTTEAASRES